ncbi:acetoacetate metabolism regulatory protein AtoC [Desulfoluna limicola]|uniref:Acetoacetate metabolism regulatory protein AtoC n=1 Tax=Desulfoluna limicola TaxID=2810562 RepID=A0ABN6F6Z1_9BACT|nr:sigma-54 dependent transcriptional regulator [Desulfoluna limicola]BCS97934.1 acetoacetate metabolism regulatory protein AtoC [Desulfoluna limicola]
MTKNISILVVDDDTSHRTMLATLLSRWDYTIFEANDGEPAIEMVKEQCFDLILMDIRMLKISGLEAMEVIKQINPTIPIVIMTAYASIDTAVGAIKNGAYDYLTKPIDFDKLRLTMERATKRLALEEASRKVHLSRKDQFNRRNIIARSAVMTELLDTVAQVATSDATVLISGESGTGKKLIARATHDNSSRAQGPFVTINCRSVPQGLLEAQLFGHKKGAFTGTGRHKESKFIEAHGGSIFMEEVSELPPALQARLLHILQERETTRVDSGEVVPIDVRVITATNKNLAALVREGKFREDLYYRLSIVNLYLPSLYERREDIPSIAEHYLKRQATKNQKEITGFTQEAMEMMMGYRWPGNVRELITAVKQGVDLCEGRYIGRDALHILEKRRVDPFKTAGGFSGGRAPLEKKECEADLFALSVAPSNISAPPGQLAVSRKILHKKLRKYGITP